VVSRRVLSVGNTSNKWDKKWENAIKRKCPTVSRRVRTGTVSWNESFWSIVETDPRSSVFFLWKTHSRPKVSEVSEFFGQPTTTSGRAPLDGAFWSLFRENRPLQAEKRHARMSPMLILWEVWEKREKVLLQKLSSPRFLIFDPRSYGDLRPNRPCW